MVLARIFGNMYWCHAWCQHAAFPIHIRIFNICFASCHVVNANSGNIESAIERGYCKEAMILLKKWDFNDCTDELAPNIHFAVDMYSFVVDNDEYLVCGHTCTYTTSSYKTIIRTKN